MPMRPSGDDDLKTTPFTRDGEGDRYRRPAPAAHTAAPEVAMFNAYKAAKQWKAPPWAAPLLIAMAVGHVVLFVTMWAKSIWEIEQLEKPKNVADLAIAPPPPPPPPPPKGSNKPKDVTIQPKKLKVRDIVQPVKMEQKETVQEVSNAGGADDGEEGGVEGGVSGGVVGTPPPQIVAPTVLEAQRIAGEKNIYPDDVTKMEIQRSGKDKITAAFKLCITAEGGVSSVSLIKSSSFANYDAKIQREMRQWRYRSVVVGGKPVPVCTSVTFVYSQK
jgi:periplasmic protein TonB